MKQAVVVMLLLFARTAFSQQRPVSFSEIDNRVRSIEPAAPAELADILTKDYVTDREKLRSIFSWITEHISYRVRKNYAGLKVNSQASHPVFTDNGNWKSANDVVAETVLQNRSAVCDGYARLFKSLCDYAGIRCAVISGFARGDAGRQLRFRCNHTWNAVFIDSAWQLLDVTWASGYTNYSGDEFIKHYDDTYFLAAPEAFIRDHFPDDLRWTLMDKPTFPHELNGAPYKNRSFSKYRFSGYFPAGGIIEASVGDTIQIVLETTDPESDAKMASDTTVAFDDALQKIIAPVAFLEPSLTAEHSHKLLYHFCVVDDTVEWLHVLYNHDAVLRYRLKIKKEKSHLLTNSNMLSLFYP